MTIRKKLKNIKGRPSDNEASTSRQRISQKDFEEEEEEIEDGFSSSNEVNFSSSNEDESFLKMEDEDDSAEDESEDCSASAGDESEDCSANPKESQDGLSAESEDEAFSDDFEEQPDEENSLELGSGEESIDEAFDEESDLEESEVEDVPSSTKEMIKDFSSLDLQNQKKAEFIVVQQEVAEQLVELRVLMEDVVVACNQVPQHHTTVEDKETLELFEKAQETLSKELGLITNLQRDFILWNPDTAYVVKDEKTTLLPSEETEDHKKDVEKISKGKRKLEDSEVSATLAKRLKLYRTYRNEVIERYDKYAVSKADKKTFVSFEEPTTKNIERALDDMPNLVKKTQVQRIDVKVIGKEEVAPQQQTSLADKTDEELMAESSNPQTHDTEIFDDNDFYHQLLRWHQDILTSKSKNCDSFKKCQEVLERLRKKLKKKVDTRASKGRKIRYNVHKKLVHFLKPNLPPKADLDRIRFSVYKTMAQIPK